jgi:hypothetical protein
VSATARQRLALAVLLAGIPVRYLFIGASATDEASPTACIIDSQSVKSAEKGGPMLIHTGLTRAN